MVRSLKERLEYYANGQMMELRRSRNLLGRISRIMWPGDNASVNHR